MRQDARRASPDADEIDGHTLFLHQHLLGLALVLPAALAVEGPGCALHAWHAHGRAAPPLVLSAIGFYGCVSALRNPSPPPAPLCVTRECRRRFAGTICCRCCACCR